MKDGERLNNSNPDEVYDALEDLDERIFFRRKGIVVSRFLDEPPHSALREIDNFTRHCLGVSELAFEFVNENIVSCKPLSKYSGSVTSWFWALDSGWKYSPYVELFLDAINALAAEDRVFRSILSVEHMSTELMPLQLNRFIELVRELGEASTFQRRLRQEDSRLQRGLRSCKTYIDKLRERYARLLVLRVDLEFPAGAPADVPGQSIIMAKSFFKKFLNNRRTNSIFEHEVGYIWKLEYGKGRGFHYHCIFFFNGSLVKNDAYHAELIGEYWRKITDGAGIFYNCNRNPGKYQKIAVGRLEYFDLEKREALLQTLKYFFKREQCFFVRFKEGAFRTYGKGEIPPLLGDRVGRPRRKVASPI